MKGTNYTTQWRRASIALSVFCVAFIVYVLGIRVGFWPRLFDEDYSILLVPIILGFGYIIRTNLRKDIQSPKTTE